MARLVVALQDVDEGHDALAQPQSFAGRRCFGLLVMRLFEGYDALRPAQLMEKWKI